LEKGKINGIKKYFYSGLDYAVMIKEAKQVSPGAGSVRVIPTFVSNTGPFSRFNVGGTISGLTITTNRQQVYRACLEGLCYQLRMAIEVMKETTGFNPKAIRITGGGSKNTLWNQIRADVTNLPVITISQKETTALGAAIMCFVGLGVYKSIEDAISQIGYKEKIITPSKNADVYEKLYQEYKSLLN